MMIIKMAKINVAQVKTQRNACQLEPFSADLVCFVDKSIQFWEQKPEENKTVEPVEVCMLSEAKAAQQTCKDEDSFHTNSSLLVEGVSFLTTTMTLKYSG